jgi:hypothetical protein
MAGGINEYQGREFDWAVDTVLYNAEEMRLLDGSHDAEALVSGGWEFIFEVFDEEQLERPDQNKHIATIQAREEFLETSPVQKSRRWKRDKGDRSLSPEVAQIFTELANLRSRQRRKR